MNATLTVHQTCFRSIAPAQARPIGLGILAVVLFLLPGCATQKPVGVTHSDAPPPAEPLRLDPGTIAVLTPRTPAGFSFDKADGRTDYAADGAGNAAREILTTPHLGDPRAEAAAGVVGFALAPFAAAVGAVSAGLNKLTPNQLMQSESDLAQAMALMAGQQHLRDCLLKTACDKTHRNLVPIESMDRSPANRGPVSAVLETTVEELRLERTASSDASFALLIKTRARLLRTSDGAVLYDQPFEYRSGTALFHEWTLNQAFRNVADTGYRKLAEQMVEQLLLPASDGPVLIGAGFKKSPARAPDTQTMFASAKSLPPERPLTQFANYPVASPGAIGIYSTATVAHVAIQMPSTKDEAVSEAVRDVEWSLDGLHEFPNLVVQLTACAAAIPMSLGKQTVGAIRGLTRKRYQAAEAQLSAAARESQPHQELAYQVAQQLSPKTSQPVVLVKKPLPAGAGSKFALMQCVARGTLAWLPKDQTAANYLGSQGADTALEIHVLSAALNGTDGINPPLAVCVEAQATLLRVRDGQKLYSCPVHYRSAGRKFTEWAANDARLFRQELEQSYRESGRAIVDHLVSRRLIAPGQPPHSILADNSN